MKHGKIHFINAYMAQDIHLPADDGIHIAVHMRKGSFHITERLPMEFKGYNVCYYEPNDELGHFCNFSATLQSPLSETDTEELDMVIEVHSDKLMSEHSNLNIISPSSYKVRDGKIIFEKCIVLYCDKKGIVPYGETPFPTQISTNTNKGLIVTTIDVREAHFTLLAIPSQPPFYELGRIGFLATPAMGCSISTPGYRTGSLGVFVSSRADPLGLYFLTCDHVIEENATTVLQPSRKDWQAFQYSQIDTSGLTVVGDVCERFRGESNGNWMDAALVRLQARERPTTFKLACAKHEYRSLGLSPDLSFDHCTPGPAKINSYAYKNGRTTGLTRGWVVSSGVCARLPREATYYKKLIQIISVPRTGYVVHNWKDVVKSTNNGKRKSYGFVYKKVHKQKHKIYLAQVSRKTRSLGGKRARTKSKNQNKDVAISTLPPKFLKGMFYTDPLEKKLYTVFKDRFAREGDSGSAVFQLPSGDHPKVIGLLTGMGEPGSILATRIGPILDKFDVVLANN